MAKVRVHRPQASGYSEGGASTTRRALRSFVPSSGAPVDDIDFNNATLRQRSRMLYMSSSVATAAIDTNRTHIVGPGLVMQSTIDRSVLGISDKAAEDWQQKTEAEFRLWASKAMNCDANGLNNFASLQQLALKSWLMSGDVFAVMQHEATNPLNPYGLRIKLVEADRVSVPLDCGGSWSFCGTVTGTVPEGRDGAGNKIYDGVEVDKSGKIVAYYVCSEYPNSQVYFNDIAKWTRIPVFGKKTGLPNILHIMDSERPDQYRGVPYLAQVIEPLLQMRRYTESELMAALIQSFFSAWITTDAPSDVSMPISEATSPFEASVDKDSETEYEMGPGTIGKLNPGESIIFGSPNIPTAGFDTFLKEFYKQIGAAKELPYDVLMKEFNNSYSASRGALMEAWEAFKMRRGWFVDDFCQPIYEVWLTEAVARGRIKAPGFFIDPLIRKAWCGAQWIGPTQVQLDPVKEANAAIMMTSHAIKTHKQVTRELGGGDWDKNVEQVAAENEKLKAATGALAPAADPAPAPANNDDEGDTNNE